MDLDEEDRRPPSPVSMAPLEEPSCLLCCAAWCDGSVELAHVGFYCVACITSGVAEQPMAVAAAEQLAARAAAMQQPQPIPPRLEPRRSERQRRPVDPIYDPNKSGKGQPGWSAYELSRTGAQHSRTRGESYTEVQAERDKLLFCSRRLRQPAASMESSRAL